MVAEIHKRKDLLYFGIPTVILEELENDQCNHHL